MYHVHHKKSTQKNIKKKKKESPNKLRNTPVVMNQGFLVQQTLGNMEIQRIIKQSELQAKLFINQPHDTYEQEADKIADTIVNKTVTGELITPAISTIRRKESSGDMSVSSQIESEITSLKGKGQPLGHGVRKYLEPRFGVDLKDVRIHTNSNADRLARAINARAFTLGNDVVFARNEYKPDTHGGKQLIAHELTHVLQQGGIQRKEVQRAEWFINSRKVGVRKTDFRDIPYDLPLIGPGLRGIDRFFGATDIDTDYLPVVSDSDPVAREIDELKNQDYLSAALLVIGAALSIYTAGASGAETGSAFLGEFLKAMFVPGNPFTKTDILIAINSLLTDAGYTGEALNTLEEIINPDIVNFLEAIYNDKTKAMKNSFYNILSATKLSDFNWYDDFGPRKAELSDMMIFHWAKQANIPLEVQNDWEGSREYEKAVARQMMRNYMFIGEMGFKYRMSSPKALKMLFWGYAGPEEDIGFGIQQYTWRKGFAEYNPGPYDFFQSMADDEYVSAINEMKVMVDEMNAYRRMEYLFNHDRERFFADYSFELQDKYYFNFRRDKLERYNILLFSWQDDFQQTIFFYNKDEAALRELYRNIH